MMSDTPERPKSQYKSCLDCKADILQKNPAKCPYCGSVNLVDEEEQLANSVETVLENAGNYEKVASLIQSNIAIYFEKLKKILDQPVYNFSEATPEQVPAASGVYVIYDNSSNQMIYAGRSKNLRVRLLQQHKSGNIRGSQFRKALGQKHNLDGEAKISDYIKANCSFKLLEVGSFEEIVRLEHFITAIMAPILNTELKQ
jgi:DNA-directed RNA polymerase subunit RPC12/RpoP/predicted GIY-YIG superfamily endonuclease